MIRMKKIAALLLSALLVFSLSTAFSEEWEFERGVTIVCPWA